MQENIWNTLVFHLSLKKIPMLFNSGHLKKHIQHFWKCVMSGSLLCFVVLSANSYVTAVSSSDVVADSAQGESRLPTHAEKCLK